MGVSKKQFISDLKIGSKVESVFMVANKQVRKKKNGDYYCTLVLQDREGSIEGVIWTEVYHNTEDFSIRDFVLVEGDVGGYKGSRQLIISSLSRIEDKGDIKYSDYIKTSKKNIDEMFDAVYKIDRDLNYDLLISGAILHDIGKMREYKTVVTTEVTDEGKLLGHITIGYGWVLEKIKQIKGFPEDLKNRLLHIILSHHGHKEFGSPKRPKIMEDFIVYHADHLDADIGGYSIVLEEK